MRRRQSWLLAIPLLLAFAPPAWAQPAEQTPQCYNLPRCVGCGCRGGPGYRGPNGQCVGYRDLERICGADPKQHCTFENRPNTGLNHDCILGRRRQQPEALTE